MASSSPVKKGWWSKEEDDALRNLIAAHGTNSWSLLSRSIPGRSGKSCRLRWCNQISPDVEHRPFTADEDQVVVDTYRKIGNRWAAIARLLPGRTENSVKNRWHCNLKRRFSEDDVKKMIQPLPRACGTPKKRKFDTEVAGDVKPVIQPAALKKIHPTPISPMTDSDSGSNKEVTSALARLSDYPATILSLALPVMPPTTSPVEDKMSVMENKIRELRQEMNDVRKLLDIDELQQNRSVKIFGKFLRPREIVE